jgi:hypothetical protein
MICTCHQRADGFNPGAQCDAANETRSPRNHMAICHPRCYPTESFVDKTANGNVPEPYPTSASHRIGTQPLGGVRRNDFRDSPPSM